ncbi:LacI family DNA-binding transcriptional regulator [Nocardioides acrostichi]|uniref:LacI family DNA-binding transcriptional regulator n=1 Tax=Nocardioides acrostichi TaxID=2784339 RepID=A0A930V0Q9_9ACTN|nr:LacI family DNA-binding transcriptional regulator [Nocardioides acrostichi]MBF4163571.1 LacI family DNA-binding transcriptional regulator [Nocardioides acrostichi]
MTSIHDLARETGVSTATVSRALRGLPRVSPDTRERVLDAAVRLGYTPSPHAVGLASGGRTRTIAIVVLWVTRWYFSTVVHGAESLLRERGYDVLLYNIGGDAEARRRVLLTQLLTKRADAVMVVGFTPTPEEVLWLGRHDVPAVTLGARVDEWPSVRIDDENVARVAVEHLVALGHRRIAYVGQLSDDGLDLATPRDRLHGYRESLRAAGVDPEESLEFDGGFTLDGGREAGRRLLQLRERPTAVFCASDEMAYGVLRSCLEAGVDVPREMSVIGVDGHDMAGFFDLTTVEQPVEQQGRAAARHLLQRLDPDDGEVGLVEHVEVPTRLVVRGTTGPACA